MGKKNQAWSTTSPKVQGNSKCMRINVYDCERMLSMDSFKNAFRDDRSALGNRAWIASRAVLGKHRISTWEEVKPHHKYSLLRDRHQILRAQVVLQRIHQILVRRIRIHARPSERIDRRRHRERRHRPLVHAWRHGRCEPAL